MDARTERRLVTCLFVDVVGSTDATMRLGPERMQRRLADAFAQMSALIAEQGGTVEKYIGDAIFALFGAPTAHADDPERALRAAEACASWSSMGPASEARLMIRVGIETGEALVDLAAVDQRQRMAVGTCVSIAARLQQQADPGEILVGPTCHQATVGVARFDPLGTLSLKGLGEVDAWRFLEFGAGDRVAHVPFVGRDAELELLREASERSTRGSAMLALVVGPPGQGKSRLVEEAVRRRRTSGQVRLLQARCRPGTEVGANTPLRQLLAGDLPDPSPDGVRDRLAELLGAAEAAALAAPISHSSGLAPDERLLALPRMEQRALIADAWRRYLGELARQRPLIVTIDDVHWADPVLLRIVDRVTIDLDVPLLVLATARPEFLGSAHLRPHEDQVHIELQPLDAGTSVALARTVGDGVTGLERAAGNPLFIIELARSRTTGGDLPLTIQAAIAARLDELDPYERELLQRVSVAGETFDVRDAAVLADREPSELAGMLGPIAHLGFVTPTGTGYRFHHGLVHDVAYGRLPVAERMHLHARFAEEGVDPSNVEARAHHFWEAVRPDDAEWVWEDAERLAALRREAFQATIAAGRRLEERNQYEEAVDVYQRAVELAAEPADVGAAEARVGHAYARQGLGDEAWEHQRRALDAFAAAGSPPPSGLYADMLDTATMNWGYFKQLPDDAEVLRLLEIGEQNARTSGDDVSLARLLMERASFTGDLGGAEEIARFVDSPDAVRFADAAHRMASVDLWNGRIARALELFEKVLDRLVPEGAVINEQEARIWYGLAAFEAGDLELAGSLADQGIEETGRGSVHTRSHFLGLRSLVDVGRGDWDRVAATAAQMAALVGSNPDASFCLIGGATVGHGAIGEILAGRPVPPALDESVARMVAGSPLVQASSLMLTKVMAGDGASLEAGLAAYAPGLRLRDRQALWDVSHLMPAIALTMLERWDQLAASLRRLDDLARRGGGLAGAVATAIREEQAATGGGPPPTHEALRSLGFAGISELLRFRPSAAPSS